MRMNQAICICLTTPTLSKGPFWVFLQAFFQAELPQRADCLATMRNKQVFSWNKMTHCQLEIEPKNITAQAFNHVPKLCERTVCSYVVCRLVLTAMLTGQSFSKVPVYGRTKTPNTSA